MWCSGGVWGGGGCSDGGGDGGGGVVVVTFMVTAFVRVADVINVRAL